MTAMVVYQARLFEHAATERFPKDLYATQVGNLCDHLFFDMRNTESACAALSCLGSYGFTLKGVAREEMTVWCENLMGEAMEVFRSQMPIGRGN